MVSRSGDGDQGRHKVPGSYSREGVHIHRGLLVRGVRFLRMMVGRGSGGGCERSGLYRLGGESRLPYSWFNHG